MGAEIVAMEGHMAEPFLPLGPLPKVASDGDLLGAKGARHVRGFAGFSWGQLLLGAVLMAMIVWGFWITRQVDRMGDRRIVAMSLSGMVNDFIATEARSGNGPEQVQNDTKRFMILMQQVLGERAKRGETVIVGEAVVAGSAPDITAEIRGEVGKRMMAGRTAAGLSGGGESAPQTMSAPALGPMIAPGAPTRAVPSSGFDPNMGQ